MVTIKLTEQQAATLAALLRDYSNEESSVLLKYNSDRNVLVDFINTGKSMWIMPNGDWTFAI